MKESYGNIKLLLENIQYEKYKWKSVENWRSLYFCLACSSNTQSTVGFCVNGTVGSGKTILFRKNSQMYLTCSRKNNCGNQSPYRPRNSFPSSFANQIWACKNFLKVMDKTETGFMWLRNKFLGINEAKIKESIFAGSQRKETIKDSFILVQIWCSIKWNWKSCMAIIQKYLQNLFKIIKQETPEVIPWTLLWIFPPDNSGTFTARMVDHFTRILQKWKRTTVSKGQYADLVLLHT